MKYKNIVLIWSLLIFVVLFAYYFLIGHYLAQPQLDVWWIERNLAKKRVLAEEIIGKKIILLGGSSVFFGLQAKLMTEELKIPTVNMGIHAGLEVDYLLHLGEEYAKKGDIVVVSLEYMHYLYDGSNGAQKINYVLSHDKTYFENLTYEKRISYMRSIKPFDSIPSYVVGKIKKAVQWDPFEMNKYGDKIDNIGIMEGNIPAFDINKYKLDNKKGFDAIIDFAEFCMKNDIKLIFLYQTISKHEKYFNDKEYLNFFKSIASFFKENNLLVLDNPYSAMFTRKYIFNTENHLNNEGAKIRTLDIIKLLKEQEL